MIFNFDENTEKSLQWIEDSLTKNLFVAVMELPKDYPIDELFK